MATTSSVAKSPTSQNPLTENLSKMDLKGAPVLGNPNAPITIVEYGDFECPVCRNLHDALRGMLPNYPQVKLVFKDFPLDSVHPWARTAALAGRCVYQQNPQTFWKYFDYVYDQQDLILQPMSMTRSWTSPARTASMRTP